MKNNPNTKGLKDNVNTIRVLRQRLFSNAPEFKAWVEMYPSTLNVSSLQDSVKFEIADTAFGQNSSKLANLNFESSGQAKPMVRQLLESFPKSYTLLTLKTETKQRQIKENGATSLCDYQLITITILVKLEPSQENQNE